MTSTFITLVAVALVAAAHATSLNDIYTSQYVAAHLPADDIILGIALDASSVSATPVTGVNASGSVMFPDATIDYCDVQFAYSHKGLENDRVLVRYWLPAPNNFQKRDLSTG